MTAYLRRNAIALVALFVALGGTSVAAVGTITSDDIVDGEVKTVDLAASAVTSAKIATGAVTAADLASNAVTNVKLADASVAGAEIVDGSVAAPEIAANAVTSAKIAGGGVGNSDLAANAVTGAKVTDNALTGADVDESTLGQVPGSSRLGGVPAVDFRPGSAMATQRTDTCPPGGGWRLCAPVTLTVPSGKYFKVDVHSSMTAWGSNTGHGGLFCASYEGPTCLNGNPSGFTSIAGQYLNVSHSGSAYFGPGTHSFGMAVRFDLPIGSADTAYTTTTIRWHSYDAEFAVGASLSETARAARAKPPSVAK